MRDITPLQHQAYAVPNEKTIPIAFKILRVLAEENISNMDCLKCLHVAIDYLTECSERQTFSADVLSAVEQDAAKR